MAKNSLTQFTVIALSLIVSVNCLDIDIQRGNENVVFTCSGGDESTTILEKIVRMSLVKLQGNDQWTEVAVLRFDGSIDLKAVNASAVGRLGNMLNSYLVVTWPVAPGANELHGRYRCDVIALTNSGDIAKTNSKELKVKSRPASDLSRLADPLSERLKNSEERMVEKVNETMHDAMKSVLHSMFVDLKEYLDNRTDITVSTNVAKAEMKAMRWPEGNIRLLMPNDGCPLHPPAWFKGFVKLKALPDEKYYPLNAPLHLASPHKKDGYIYRQFCTLQASTERNRPWPAGSYCIYQLKSCPAGFKAVKLQAKIKPDPGIFYLFYEKDRNRYSGNTFSFFSSSWCCRHDGSASKPIDLPVSDPFYLTRHGDRCQEVKGMDVTQDIFLMETMDDGKEDRWIGSNTAFRPDVTFKPYKEDLCYYSKSRS